MKTKTIAHPKSTQPNHNRTECSKEQMCDGIWKLLELCTHLLSNSPATKNLTTTTPHCTEYFIRIYCTVLWLWIDGVLPNNHWFYCDWNDDFYCEYSNAAARLFIHSCSRCVCVYGAIVGFRMCLLYVPKYPSSKSDFAMMVLYDVLKLIFICFCSPRRLLANVVKYLQVSRVIRVLFCGLLVSCLLAFCLSCSHTFFLSKSIYSNGFTLYFYCPCASFTHTVRAHSLLVACHLFGSVMNV